MERMKPDDVMPLICLRCKKDIPLTMRTFEEVSYTHYSYCEDCLRKGLKALRAWDKLYKQIYDHHYEILRMEDGERKRAKLSLSNWILDTMTGEIDPEYKENEMSIKPVEEIPMTLQEQRQSYRERIRQDICYAITNRISTFEFDGDYNYKYLANYAREEANMIFSRRVYREAAMQVRKTLEPKWNDRRVFPESEFKYKNRYIRIREKKGEDRVHVYGQIDFDFEEKFYEILLADTERKYKGIEEREAERNAKKNDQS